MSTNKKPEKNEPSPGKVPLERQVYDAMRSLGFIVPTTEADVERAELLLAEQPVALPAELRNASQAIEALGCECPASKAELGPATKDVELNLARAAREGGAICPEIEQRMRRDRRDAEQRTT